MARHLHQPESYQSSRVSKSKVSLSWSVGEQGHAMIGLESSKNLIAWNSITKKDHVYIYDTLIDKQFGDKILIPEFFKRGIKLEHFLLCFQAPMCVCLQQLYLVGG